MKTVLIAIVSLFMVPSITIDTVPVNVEKSTISWEGNKVTGSHSGTINLESGSLEFDDKVLVGGNFVMDMTSIIVTDLEGDSKAKLEGHLKDDDFFGVNNFPSASYVITSVKVVDATNVELTGDLTIKGITKSYTFNMAMVDGGAQVFAIIDRTDFDIRYGSASFFDSLGDRAIYDDFELNINLAM